MEQFLNECLAPFIGCSAGSFGLLMKYLLIITSAVGSLRLVFKPLQPILEGIVEWGPLKNIQWDNKILKWVAWGLDYAASIKVAPK